MSKQRNILTGDMSTVEDEAIAISIERYNELIRKEVLYDELTKHTDVIIFLDDRVKPFIPKEEDNN